VQRGLKRVKWVIVITVFPYGNEYASLIIRNFSAQVRYFEDYAVSLFFFQCVFTDPLNKVIFVTKNYGRNITRINLTFSPSEVSFHEDETLTFLVFDKVDSVKRVSLRHLLELTGESCHVYILEISLTF
jgi:hypothetical protein